MVEDIDIVRISRDLGKCSTEHPAVLEKQLVRLSLRPGCNKPSHLTHQLLVTGHQQVLVRSVELHQCFTILLAFNCPEGGESKDPGKEMVTDPCIVQAELIFNRQFWKTVSAPPGQKSRQVFSIAMDFSADGYTRTPLAPDVGEPPFRMNPSTGGRSSRNREAKPVISRVTSRPVAGWIR